MQGVCDNVIVRLVLKGGPPLLILFCQYTFRAAHVMVTHLNEEVGAAGVEMKLVWLCCSK